MDLFKSFAGGHHKPAAGDGDKAGEGHHGSGGGETHSTAELFSSAKVVADAARCAASEGVDKVDKGRAAGAASDLLDAASDYGKLPEKGYGSYVDKAKDYLHQYDTKGHAKPSGHSDHPDLAHDGQQKTDDHHHDEKKTEDHGHDDQQKTDDYHHDEKKTEDHGHQSTEGGGVEDYLQMAQGFLTKK